MEKQKTIKVIVTFLLLIIVGKGYGNTENYLIVFMNCQSIKIGNNKMHQGNVVSEDQVIHWTNSRQRIIVKNTITHQEYKIDSYRLKDKNVKTLREIIDNNLYAVKNENRALIRDEHLGNRGASQDSHYSCYHYLLMDSLHFEAFSDTNSNLKTEAVWKNNKGVLVITPINRTPDGKFYVITTAIFKGNEPQDVKLTIREIDSEHNWINKVYKDLSIIYIPRYVGKKRK